MTADEAIGYTWSDEDLAEMDTDISTDSMAVKRNPIGEYIEWKRDTGTERGSLKNEHSVLQEYEAFLVKKCDEHPCNVSDEHVKAFAEHLKNGDKIVIKQLSRHKRVRGADVETESISFNLSERTREGYLNYVGGFYNWLESNGVVSNNPATKALSELKNRGLLNVKESDRPKIEFEEMQNFLKQLTDPYRKSFILFCLKTGVRHGEACNIDLRDLHLDHPVYDWYLDTYDIKLVKEIEDKPDSLFIMPSFQKGTVVRGEKRNDGQKRKRKDGTVIPVDEELKNALLEYLLTRKPPKQDAPCHPLFVLKRNIKERETERTSNSSNREQILRHAFGEYGWYESGAGIEDNIDIHYLRHYFTHNHRHMGGVYDGHMPEGVIAYVRGDADSGDTARETTYAHGNWDDWEKTVKEPYLDGIYQFGLYD